MLQTNLESGAIDEVTGEQGYIDVERSCFLGLGTTTSMLGSPDRFEAAN